MRIVGDDDLMNLPDRGEVFPLQQPIDRFLEVTDSFFRLPGFKSVGSELLENINLFVIDIDEPLPQLDLFLMLAGRFI
ncbi:MAG: hypothetical protein BWY50_02073 [Spirochaetes bacterium ADurb.Bin315]|nr:MAG: hypothetical protein BWY50_02073 [Spirochaetes bacterium ADurb.Bin315]